MADERGADIKQTMSARQSSVIPSFRLSPSIGWQRACIYIHIYISIYIRYFHERTQLRYRLGGYSISALKSSNVPLLLQGDTTTSRSGNGLLHVERTSTKFSLRRKTSLTLWPIDKDNENSLKHFNVYLFSESICIVCYVLCYNRRMSHVRVYETIHFHVFLFYSCKNECDNVLILQYCVQ